MTGGATASPVRVPSAYACWTSRDLGLCETWAAMPIAECIDEDRTNGQEACILSDNQSAFWEPYAPSNKKRKRDGGHTAPEAGWEPFMIQACHQLFHALRASSHASARTLSLHHLLSDPPSSPLNCSFPDLIYPSATSIHLVMRDTALDPGSLQPQSKL